MNKTHALAIALFGFWISFGQLFIPEIIIVAVNSFVGGGLMGYFGMELLFGKPKR